MKRWWDSYLLVAAALTLAIFIRLQGLDNTYIKAFDPYFFWRVAEGIWEKGYWAGPDPLRYYPYGWNSTELAPFLPYGMVYLGKIAGDLKAAVKFYPAFFGILSILAMAFLGRELGMSGLSSLLLAVFPAYMYRTAQGFADKEPAAFFLGLLSWFFLLRAIKRESVLDAIYGGISAGLIATIWGGKIIFVLSLAPLFLLLFLREESDKLLHIGIYYTSYVLLHLFVPRYARFWLDPYSLFIFALGISGITVYFLYRIEKLKQIENKQYIIAGIVLLFLFLFSLLFFHDPFLIIRRVYEKAMSPTLPTGRITHYHTVAENQRPTWTWNLKSNQFYQQFGLFFFIAVAISLLLLGSRKYEDLFVASVTLFAVYQSFSAIRLFSPASLGIALGSAYGIKKLLEHRDKVVAGTGYLLLFLSLYLLYPYAAGSAAALRGTSMTPTWFENLKWMAFNIPENEPVVTWWDYGYWIQTVAHRITLGDGGNLAPGQVLNWYTGHFFATDDYENATNWAKSWNLTYFTVDYAMIPKYWAYSTLGGISDVIGSFTLYQQPIYSEFGFVNIYVGYLPVEIYNSLLGIRERRQIPVAIAPVTVGGKLYPMVGNITGNGVRWWGVAREFAVIRNDNIAMCPPEGYCQAEPLGRYPLLNYSVVFYGNQVFAGDHQAMHSIFARLWFFHGYGTDFKLLLNNGECKTFKAEW